MTASSWGVHRCGAWLTLSRFHVQIDDGAAGIVDFAVFSFRFDYVCCFLERSFLVRNWCGRPRAAIGCLSVQTSYYESGGQEFESLRARHFGTELGTPKPAGFALEAATRVRNSSLFDPMMRSSFASTSTRWASARR